MAFIIGMKCPQSIYLKKNLFINHEHRYTVTPTDLQKGYIGNQTESFTHSVNLPTIRDVDAFIEELFTTWLRVNLRRKSEKVYCIK